MESLEQQRNKDDMRHLIIILFLTGCSVIDTGDSYGGPVEVAKSMIGMHESYDRIFLKEFMRVDPIRTEWCAAFINSVLNEAGIPGSESVHRHPLLARSFLHWGERIDQSDVMRGDVVIFPRGSEGWQGHVGFFYDSYVEDGIEYWLILGGNQEDQVSIAPYPRSRVIGVRRYETQPRS
jgi:uncharacterized protein (TIGR02594 family)